MIKEEESIQILQKLGLSRMQARIWLTIFQLGEANVTEISKTARIDRSESFKVIKKLQELGLIDELIGFPKKFRVTPIQDGLSVLLLSKEKEYRMLRKKVMSFTQNTNHVEFSKDSIVQKRDIVLLENKKRVRLFLDDLVSKAKKSIDLSGDWQGFRGAIAHNSDTCLTRLQKKVHLRVVISRPDREIVVSEIFQFLKENPNVELRFFDKSETPVFLWIVDCAQIVMPTITQTNFEENEGNVSPLIFSNAHPLIQVGQMYFDSIWSTATPQNRILSA